LCDRFDCSGCSDLCDHFDSSGYVDLPSRVLKFLVVKLYFFTIGLAAMLYVLSRLFIPLEAFISIRSLPVGAFETVAWAEYWPHV
jgi:hypothetical protein